MKQNITLRFLANWMTPLAGRTARAADRRLWGVSHGGYACDTGLGARAADRCEHCHVDEQWQFVRSTIDHVVPRSDAGGDEVDNLALACRNCNERRGNRSEAVDPQTGETVALFDPRAMFGMSTSLGTTTACASSA